MGTGKFNAWGNSAMDKHHIQSGVEILLLLNLKTSTSLLDQLGLMQTLPGFSK